MKRIIMCSLDDVIVTIFKLTLVTFLLADRINGVTEDKEFWYDNANAELKDALNYKWNTNVAKNVIVFVGDGMSLDTITATRILYKNEEGYLAWEKFPHVGLLKTYNVDKQVPDSASTATALFSGVKTNNNIMGLDANVPEGDCAASLLEKNQIDNIFTWAMAMGKDTGFVTTTRVTHATPGPLYAHSPNRRWECDKTKPETASACKDIARQLIEDKPGRDIKVIMGGGRQMLESHAVGSDGDPLDTWACYSEDGRHLMADWAEDKEERNVSHVTVQNNEELFNVDTENTDFLLGIFANGFISMDYNRDPSPQGQPSLENMTTTAIRMLQKSQEGFVLVVEGGLIDYAHHRGHAAQALQETIRFSEAIDTALQLVDTSETLVIVTSDHSHAMNIQGVSDRKNNILGLAQKSRSDNIPYTVLGYSTGGPNNMAYRVNDENAAIREDPSEYDTTSFTYSQQAVVITDEAQHSGGDVAIYATGPYAHLFHSTHEQQYVAHVIRYAIQAPKSHASSLKACLFILLTVALPFL